MALISRNAEENFFNSLPTELHDDLIKNYYDQNESDLTFLSLFFNFSVGVVGKRYLVSRGIRLSPMGGTVTHSHPICKIIENHFLYVSLPHILSKSRRFALMSIKENKAQYIYKRNELISEGMRGNRGTSFLPDNKRNNEAFKVINRIFEPKDYARYDEVTEVKCPFDNRNWFDVVGSLLGPKSGVDLIFIHDEVHHWSKSDMAYFLSSTEVETLLFTVVFPPEIIRSQKNSMNPSIYSFEVSGDDVFFFPDASNTIPYHQSKSKGMWILSCGQMAVTTRSGQRVLYSFQMIENHGAHSLFICTRRKVKNESRRFFKDFEGSDLSELCKEDVILKDRGRNGSIYCSHDLLEKVINYIVCLKKPDVESALAKLRQLTDSACHPDEVYLLHNIMASFIACKDFFEKGILSFASLSIKSLLSMALQLTPSIEALIGTTNLSRWRFLRSLFMNLKRFQVTVDTEFIDGDLEIQYEGKTRYQRIGGKALINLSNYCKLASPEKKKNFFLKESHNFSPYHSLKRPFSLDILSCNQTYSIGSDLLILFEERNELIKEAFSKGIYSLFTCLCLKDLKSRWFNGFLEFEGSSQDSGIPLSPHDDKKLVIHSSAISGPDLSFDVSPADQGLTSGGSTSSARETKADSVRQNSCFIRAISAEINMSPDSIIRKILTNREAAPPSLIYAIEEDLPISIKDLDFISKLLDLRVTMLDGEGVVQLGFDDDDKRSVTICKRRGHAFNLPGPALSKEKFLDGLAHKISDSFFLTSRNPEFFSSFDLSIDVKSASLLVDSLFHNDFGALLDRSKIKKGGLFNPRLGDPTGLISSLRSVGDKVKIMTKTMILPVLGFAGSGKTSSLLKIMHDVNLKDFEWISPRSELLKDIKFGNENASDLKHFSTFEVGLSRSKDFNKLDNIIIVLDEVFLLPNGFIDLMVMNILISFELERLTAKKGVLKLQPKELECNLLDFLKRGTFERIGPEVLIIALGDPLQTKFFSSEAPSLNRARSFREIIGGSEIKNYLNYSRRFGSFLDNSFDLSLIPNADPLSIKVVSSLDSVSPGEGRFGVIVASQEDKRKYSFNFDQISTIGESQGRTFDEALLILTRSIYKSDKETILTALTRARRQIWIWIPKDMESNLKGPGEGVLLLNSVLSKNNQGVLEIVSSMKSGLRLFNFEERVGSDFELKTEGDLFLRSGLSFLSKKDVAFEEISVNSSDSCPREPKMKVHISLAPQNYSMLESSSLMRSREYRELKDGSVWSEQFNDTFKMGGFNSDCFNQSMAPSAVFPRHQSSDSVTFWAAVKKRLVFKDSYSNLRNFEKAEPIGRTMLNVFLEHIKLNPDWDGNLYEEARMEFEEKKISKSSALISNHSIRSDSDWPKENFFLFMKNQSCKKLEKMFCDGKAGQTLACFAHSVLLRFGPLNRYIEKKVSSSLPKRFYIHQKKNFEDLEKWVIEESFDQECTESDYEAFDASQDHFALAFEVELMKFLQVPSDLIEDYKWLKCHTHCRLGNMAIMRFTGEFCTFMFNTLVNMVFTFLAYDICDSSICFAGDDMCANRRLRRQSKYSSILENFSLKAKVDFTYTPSFCGWRLFKHGIVKSPTLVAARVEMAKQKTVGGVKGFSSNDIALVCDSYFLEVMFTYRKGDLIFGLLSEREMYHFYNVMRFFVKYKRYLSPASRQLLESDKESNLYLGGEVGSTILFDSFRSCLDRGNISTSVLSESKSKIDVSGWYSSKMEARQLQAFNHSRNCATLKEIEPIRVDSGFLGLRSFCENVAADLSFSLKIGLTDSSSRIIDISKTLGCQSLMGESFWNSRQGQIRRFLLMGSLLPTSTVMLEASKEKLQMLSRDSKSILQFQLKALKEQLPSISHSSMILKGTLLLSRVMTSAFCIIQRSFSLSLGFLTQLARSRESLSFLMREQLALKLPSRKDSLSILAKQTGRIISTVLTPLSRYQIHILQNLSSYASSSLVLISSLGRIVSSSILELCTAYSTTQMIGYAEKKLSRISFRNFKQQTKSQIFRVLSASMSYVSMRIDQFRTLVIRRSSLLSLMDYLEERKRGFPGLGSTKLTLFLNRLGQFNSRLMKSFLDFLGQILTENLEVFLLGYQRGSFENFWLEKQESMSIKNLLESEMKEGIQDYVWRNIIDANNQMNMSPAVGTNLTQELAERKAFILRHFFKYLAGNLAVEGTSEQTKYPDHTIRLPPIPAARLGGTENLAMELNMVETIGAMRAWRDTLPMNHPNRNATLRQMATPFADHALEFLVEHANDVKTNLAASHPELAKAPEVAFDFARGLSPRHTVHALRAQTIGAFTGRTFRTEGQKGVFTAQGTVNVSYDG